MLFVPVGSMKRKGPLGPATPATILGASLTDWFDAREDVSVVGSRASGWGNQASGGDAAQGVDGSRPLYVASGADDGTPEISFTRTADGFNYSAPVPTAFTCWVFMKCPSDVAGCLLISEGNTGSIWVEGYPAAGRPGIHDGTWHDPGPPNVGWRVTRFSVRDSGVGPSHMAVDDGAQSSGNFNWALGGTASWTHLSRVASGHAILGEVKQIVIANQFYDDSDPEHAAVLAYFKETYPTLVLY